MNNSPNIEVGIIEADRITFNLSGKFELFGTGKTCYNECKAYVSNDNIVIENEGKEYEPGKKLTIVPCDLNTDYFELNDVVIGVGFHWEKKEHQKFQGALKLRVKGDKLLVINVIPVENYLLSVISSEMNSTSSLELLKAHAIISRSWLMAQLADGKNKEVKKPEKTTSFDPANPPEEFISWYDREDHADFHVCADDHCQRYQGIERMKNPNVIKAVNETRGEVLLYTGEICDARYSKCCGGITERFENCWENDPKPYLVSVFDGPETTESKTVADNEESMREYINSSPGAFCNTSDKKILSQVLNDYDLSTHDFFRWEVKYSSEELSKILFERSGVDFGRIKDLVPVKRTKSGRLVKLKIVGEKRSMVIGKELIIRKWLSKSHLYSSAFIIERVIETSAHADHFILKGAGWGHGVGLCQIGAAVMGEKGYSYRDILGHYYKGTILKKLYQ